MTTMISFPCKASDKYVVISDIGGKRSRRTFWTRVDADKHAARQRTAMAPGRWDMVEISLANRMLVRWHDTGSNEVFNLFV